MVAEDGSGATTSSRRFNVPAARSIMAGASAIHLNERRLAGHRATNGLVSQCGSPPLSVQPPKLTVFEFPEQQASGDGVAGLNDLHWGQNGRPQPGGPALCLLYRVR
jgi:hypothetical protein